MEPYWLKFLNQSNLLVCVDNCQIVRDYLRVKLGRNVRLGKYVWFSRDELNRLDDYIRDPSGFTPDEPSVNLRRGWDDYFAPQPSFTSPAPSKAGSACKDMQYTLYKLQCEIGSIKVPTWYAKRYRVPPWIIRSRCRKFSNLQKVTACLMRLHYVNYVMLPSKLCGRPSSHGMKRSDSDLCSHLLWRAYHVASHVAAAKLHSRLKVLLLPQLREYRNLVPK